MGKSVLAVLTYCSGGCSGVHPSGRAESPARRGPPSVAPAACSPPPAGVVLALIALILRMEGAPGPTSLLRQLLTCVRSPAACWSLLPFGHLRCVAAQRSGGASSFMPHEGTRRRCAAAHIRLESKPWYSMDGFRPLQVQLSSIHTFQQTWRNTKCYGWSMQNAEEF